MAGRLAGFLLPWSSNGKHLERRRLKSSANIIYILSNSFSRTKFFLCCSQSNLIQAAPEADLCFFNLEVNLYPPKNLHYLSKPIILAPQKILLGQRYCFLHLGNHFSDLLSATEFSRQFQIVPEARAHAMECGLRAERKTPRALIFEGGFSDW